MLKVNNIKKEFKKSISKKKQITFYADNNISFEAKPGEIIGILGPNGAGNELLEMCGNYYQVPKDKLNARINMIVKKFDMESFAHQKIENLSTGQYQRTNIARVLIHDPKYYILDEVTSGLDVISSQVILEFVKEERNRKKCILYSTHYMEEAEHICDRIIMLNKGQIIANGSKRQLFCIDRKWN